MHSASLNDYFKAVFERRDGCDVVLEAVQEDGTSKDLACHLLIASRSEVLETALRGPFVEGSTKRVRIPVESVKHAEAVVEFLYTDCMRLESCSFEDVIQVMVLAEKYLLGGAFAFASKELERSLREVPVREAQSVIEELSRKVGSASLRGVLRSLVTAVASNLTFGKDVLSFLVWLVQMQEAVGVCLKEEADLCMDYVDGDTAKMRREVGTLMQSFTLRDGTASIMTLLVVLQCLKQKGGDAAHPIKQILELGLFDAFEEQRRTPCRVAKDATVEAIVDLESDSKQAFEVRKGTRGLVLKIDEDGDANIAFEGISKSQWVLSVNFWKFRVVEAQEEELPGSGAAASPK